MADDLKKMYKTIEGDPFHDTMNIQFGSGKNKICLTYSKVTWDIGGKEEGLRYGENPGQPAAMYKLTSVRRAGEGIGETLSTERLLTADLKLIQSGKHPGKTNLTDTDNAMNILRHLTDKPTVAILKHNNPCGVATASNIAEAYVKADLADRIAAFGGAIVMNRTCEADTAEEIIKRYSEVVAAPDFTGDAIDLFKKKKNLRVVQVKNMEDLGAFQFHRFIDFKSLLDGSQIVQLSYVPQLDTSQWVSAESEYKGNLFKINREPTKQELSDMVFGWAVESGVTSNSVIYVKNGVTVGIGTGEQDRVGVAEIARDKAYNKLADRYCFEEHGISMNELKLLTYHKINDIQTKYENEKMNEIMGNNDAKSLTRMEINIDERVQAENGGLKGSVMVSDAFFPFRDGIDVGLREGVIAVVQPGGSENDYQSIQACNESKAAMMYTKQRSFKH
ncbi:IMP cyclohydrolase [candidate division KSB1 bacterium]